MAWLRQHFFSFTLVALLAFVMLVSYVRFMVLHDYVVAYEGDCDPYTESCFVGCEDDECTEEYYYFLIQKYAPNVQAQCGPDITDCDAAYECLPEDGEQCEITYCDPIVDGEETCELFTEADMESETESEEMTEDDSVEISEEESTDSEVLKEEDEGVLDGSIEVEANEIMSEEL